MTAPDQQPSPQEPNPAEAVPEGLAREVDAVDVDALDKQNRGWTEQYRAQLEARLVEEQAADSPDLVMISYLKREIATYEELLRRTSEEK